MGSFLLPALLVVFLLGQAEGEHETYPPGVTAAYLLRLRGFIADEFSLTTKSGYVLRLTRGRNPLFEGRPPDASKEPILFIHGVLCDSNNFLLNSFNVRPKDLSGLDFNSMNLNETRRALQGEPSSKSLAFLALNRGHVVWLLNRRGTFGSQQLLGDPFSVKAKPTSNRTRGGTKLGNLASSLTRLFVNQPRTWRDAAFGLDVRFWDYSLDQQSVDDFPLTIDFILNRTTAARRLAIVGHSAGGALTLIGLSQLPPAQRRRVSVAVLWSPSYATSNKNAFFNLFLKPLVKLTSLEQGPMVMPPFLVEPFISSAMTVCSSPRTWRSICEHYYDKWFGPSGGKQPMRPHFLAFAFFLTSGHELAQQGQQLQNPPNHTMRKYDYGPVRNLLEYGQPNAPAYDLSNLDNSTRYSFYSSPHDILVTPADVQKTRAQLRIPSLHTVINNTFNHIGFFFHDDVENLVVIPSMYDIELLAKTFVA